MKRQLSEYGLKFWEWSAVDIKYSSILACSYVHFYQLSLYAVWDPVSSDPVQ